MMDIRVGCLLPFSGAISDSTKIICVDAADSASTLPTPQRRCPASKKPRRAALWPCLSCTLVAPTTAPPSNDLYCAVPTTNNKPPRPPWPALPSHAPRGDITSDELAGEGQDAGGARLESASSKQREQRCSGAKKAGPDYSGGLRRPPAASNCGGQRRRPAVATEYGRQRQRPAVAAEFCPPMMRGQGYTG
jgi:hypothetical protein